LRFWRNPNLDTGNSGEQTERTANTQNRTVIYHSWRSLPPMTMMGLNGLSRE
jgi:hypothetical protein